MGVNEGDEPSGGDAIIQAIADAIQARVDTEEKIKTAGTEYADLPEQRITLNQLIAYNMAYFRKAAGFKQEELGELLAGWVSGSWSKAAVSAAERSWDGKRIRQFDADLIYGLAHVFGLPIGALFLPPDRDGIDFRYVIVPPHEAPGVRPQGMSELLTSVLTDVIPDEDVHPDDDNLFKAYQSRVKVAASMYLAGPLTPGEIFGGLADEEQLAERAARLRGHYDALRGVLSELDGMLEYIYARMAKVGPRQLKAKMADPAFLAASARVQQAKMEKVLEQQKNEALGRYANGDSVEKIAVDLGWSPLYVASVIERASKEGTDETP